MHVPSRMESGEALALFRRLAPVDPAAIDGDWRGHGIDTGHPLDALLRVSGWHGKHFEAGRADPLVMDGAFGRYRLNPGLTAMGLAMRLDFARWPLAGPLIAVIGPLLATRKPRARLEMAAYEGIPSAAMIYDQKPITDHFRRIDENRLMGLMERRGETVPCFFVLEREP